MKPVSPELPGAEIVFMTLYDKLSTEWLDKDLAFIRLADGTKAEVGWYGELHKGGHFKVVHYRHSWHRPIGVFKESNVAGVANVLRNMARDACTRCQPFVSPTMSDRREFLWPGGAVEAPRTIPGSTTGHERHIISWKRDNA